GPEHRDHVRNQRGTRCRIDPRRAWDGHVRRGEQRSRPARHERDLRADRRQPPGPPDPRVDARGFARRRPADHGRADVSMKRRYLITGAQGLIGRYLAARILGAQRDAEVLGVGRSHRIDGFFTHAIRAGDEPRPAPMPAGLHACLDGRYRYRQLSLLETGALRDLIRDFRPDCIFHLASALHTASERDLFEINVEGTASLMNALCDSPETLLIAGSSASVYGEACALPIQESHPCRPADTYGVTKLTAEHLVRVKAERAGLPFVLARIFSVVGPGQTETHVCGRFAAQVAALAGIPHPALEVGPLDPTRDFI